MLLNADSNDNLTFRAIVLDAVLSPRYLKAIDVLAPGVLTVEDLEGNIRTYTFVAPAYDGTGAQAHTLFPYRLRANIRRVLSTTDPLTPKGEGTDLTVDTEIIGLH